MTFISNKYCHRQSVTWTHHFFSFLSILWLLWILAGDNFYHCTFTFTDFLFTLICFLFLLFFYLHFFHISILNLHFCCFNFPFLLSLCLELVSSPARVTSVKLAHVVWITHSLSNIIFRLSCVTRKTFFNFLTFDLGILCYFDIWIPVICFFEILQEGGKIYF